MQRSCPAQSSERDFLVEHLVDLPAFRALFRSIEARLLAEVDLRPPLLDLGCGDGHFGQVALPRPVDAGIDPDARALAEASRRGVYRLLCRGSATALPYVADSFATVVCNCVIEHLENPDQLLAEVARVLRPGGRFVLTTIHQHFADMLFFPTQLRRLGLERLAAGYAAWFNRRARHLFVASVAEWQARLERAGLEVERWQYYLPPAGARLFDLAHYYSIPCLLIKRLTGRWTLVRRRWNFRLVEAVLRRWYLEAWPETGAGVFFLCRRV